MRSDHEDEPPLRGDPEAVTLPPAPRLPTELEVTEPQASLSGPPTERPVAISREQADEILSTLRTIATDVSTIRTDLGKNLDGVARLLDQKFSEHLASMDREVDKRVTMLEGATEALAKVVGSQKEITTEHARRFAEQDAAHGANGNGVG